jgi:hypothetical protein
MAGAEEIQYDNDCLVITIDIVDCPMAEIPLTEVFNFTTMPLLDNYHDVICNTVLQQFEDTTWLSENQIPTLTDPGFGMYHARDRNSINSLQKPALQRLIIQRLKDRQRPSNLVHVPVLIRFLIPDVGFPKPPGSSVASGTVHKSHSQRSRRGLPSVIDTSVQEGTPPDDDALMNKEISVAPSGNTGVVIVPPVDTGPTFRGQPVDTRPTGGHGPPVVAGRFQSTPKIAPPSPHFASATTERTTGTLLCTPTRMHPFSTEVTFGAESFENNMCQFMCGEVKFKDFRKASIPKFDPSKNASFVHWCKLFCSTFLQWGVWCPSYESAHENSIHVGVNLHCPQSRVHVSK